MCIFWNVQFVLSYLTFKNLYLPIVNSLLASIITSRILSTSEIFHLFHFLVNKLLVYFCFLNKWKIVNCWADHYVPSSNSSVLPPNQNPQTDLTRELGLIWAYREDKDHKMVILKLQFQRMLEWVEKSKNSRRLWPRKGITYV